MKKILTTWGPVVLWCGLIFFLSSQPHLPGPEDKTWDFVLKKAGHLTVYFILFRLVYRAYGKQTKHRMLRTFLICIAYAASDEFHQSFVPGRTPMIRDIGIDIIGMIGSGILARYERKIPSASRKN
ncbi:MAG: VanZ family protein [Candidatus Woesebacteria bacterium]